MEYKHYKHKTLQHGGVVPAAGAGRLHRPQRPQDPQHPRGVQPRAAHIRDLRHQGLNSLTRVVFIITRRTLCAMVSGVPGCQGE